jgi:REP element-mobilizing transposase RayT
MSRPIRLEHRNAHHHVYNRGARRSAIFLDDEDCITFLALLGALPKRFGLEVQAYALMSNHFHLLLVSRRGRLGAGMQFLQGEYAAKFNGRHGFDGPLYKGRYANHVVEDDTLWAHLLAYVHLNPVKAHLVGDPAEASWTSHAAYLNRASRPEWLSTAEHLELLGGEEGLDTYVRDVQVGRERGPADFDPEAWEGAIPGESTVFPAVRPASIPPSQALAEVAAVVGVSTKELSEPGRGRRGAPARWVALAWLVERSGMSQADAGRRLGAHPVVVCRAVARVRTLEGRDNPVARWMTTLRSGKE